jgi:hypothetical protein
VSLIQTTDGWLPTKIHGEVVLPDGADIEATILAALKKLMIPSQIPAYTDIRYQIKTDITTAGKTKLSTKASTTQRLFFELD